MRRKEFKGVRNITYMYLPTSCGVLPLRRHMFNDGTKLSLFAIVKRGRLGRRIGTYL